MNGAELRSSLEFIFGERWRIPAAQWLGVDLRTIERQTSGFVEPQGPVVAAVRERLALMELRAAAYRRTKRWLAKSRKLGPRQRQILQNAADGLDLLTGREANPFKWGGWEAATLSLIDCGWLDEDRQITDLGRQVLKERG